VSGVAAKGLIAGATVTAHLVDANGNAEAQAAATADAPTDAQGRYRLTLRGAGTRPVVIRITAPAGGATHRDEVTGATQALPAGFSMRAVVMPSTSTLTVNVTPFTEMATEAAEDQGLTAANVAQANHTVKLMLGLGGGELTAVPVRNTTDAGTPDEQRLAVMLTAVSQMAASGALGCTGDAGARTRCVVEGLSNSMTATNSFSLGATVGPAFARSVEAVLQNPVLLGNVPASLLAPALNALQCQGVTCTAPAGPTTTLDAPGAIAATKTLFTDLKSDIVTLFGDNKSVARGEVEVQNDKFSEAMGRAQAPAELTAKTTALLLTGVDLYNDYKAGRTTQPSRTRGANEGFSNEGFPTSTVYAGACTLFQDSGTTQVATAPANARFVGCSTRYYYQYQNGTEYAHGFTLTPSATAGTFTYQTRARTRTNGVNNNLGPAAGPASGTLVTAVDGNGRIISFSATGSLAGAFEAGGKALVSDSHTWDVSGTRTIDASNPKLATVTMSGSVVAKNASGAVLGTLQVKTATLSEIPVSRDAQGNLVAPNHPNAVATAGGELAAGTLSVLWTVPDAEFEGTISATNSAWDKSLTLHVPTRLLLEGRLALIAAGVKTDYITGRLSATVSGFEQYSDVAPVSPTNRVTVNATLAATVTAPGRPLLALDAGTTWLSDEAEPRTSTVAYRSYNGNTPRSAIQLAVRRTTATGDATVTITDPTNNISVSALQHAASADVMLNGTTKIGVLDPNTGVLTFTDGSFVSAGF
jgi:hypothetical protein